MTNRNIEAAARLTVEQVAEQTAGIASIAPMSDYARAVLERAAAELLACFKQLRGSEGKVKND